MHTGRNGGERGAGIAELTSNGSPAPETAPIPQTPLPPEPAGTRLDVELTRRGLAGSRTRARALIAAGRVVVDGVVTAKASMQISGRDIVVQDDGEAAEYASRAGYKLAGALAGWPQLSVRGRRCLDAGASTGGFTDVLLRCGAAAVVAVDVGSGQLRPELAADPRVTVLDRCNVRSIDADRIGGAVELTVCDLSFISLRLVLPALVACTAPTGDLVPMVKPQFEVGRERLGRGGVVRSRVDRIAAIDAVARRAAELGWGAAAVARSSLPGPAGNEEYFLWLRTDRGDLDRDALAAAVDG